MRGVGRSSPNQECSISLEEYQARLLSQLPLAHNNICKHPSVGNLITISSTNLANQRKYLKMQKRPSTIVQSTFVLHSEGSFHNIRMASNTKRTKPKSASKTAAKRYFLRSLPKNRMKKPKPSLVVTAKPMKTKLIKKAPKLIHNASRATKKSKQTLPIKKQATISRSVSKTKKSARHNLHTRSSLKLLPKTRARRLTDNSFIKDMLSSSFLKCERKAKLTRSVSKPVKKIQASLQKQKRSMQDIVKAVSKISRSKPKPKQISKPPMKDIDKPNQPLERLVSPRQAYQLITKQFHQSKKNDKKVGPNQGKKKRMKEALQAKEQKRSLIVIAQDTEPLNTPEKKTIQQLEQLNKVRKQRLYLLDITKKPEQLTFFISKAKLKKETVRITPQAISCSCINFRLHRMMCKDIKFIVGNILHNEEVLFHLRFKTQIHEAIYHKLSDQIMERLPFYFDEASSQSQASTNQCLICFSDLNQIAQKLEKCDNCGHQFHSICYNVFIRSQQKCPKCKQSIVVVKQELTQPIDELDALKI